MRLKHNDDKRAPGSGKDARPAVSMADVERVVARMAGIPLRTVSGKERAKLAGLEKELKNMVFGQDQAIELTVRAILRARAGLGQEQRRPEPFYSTVPRAWVKPRWRAVWLRF